MFSTVRQLEATRPNKRVRRQDINHRKAVADQIGATGQPLIEQSGGSLKFPTCNIDNRWYPFILRQSKLMLAAHVFSLAHDQKNRAENNPKEGVFSHTDDFIKLTEVARKFPRIHELDLDSKAHYDSLIEIIKRDEDIVPLFIKNKTGFLDIIPAFSKGVKLDDNSKLVYLGKKMVT